MKPKFMLIAFLIPFLFLSRTTSAQDSLRRFLLVIGANFGGADRPSLLYAVSDGDRFARVMSELGGVASSDTMVLKEPKVRDLVETLNRLNQQVIDARRTNGTGRSRTEVLVYYSGHADEKGILLGDDRYSYRSLRDRLDEIPADVRIAVLDACASGAFTRLKGGMIRKPFLVDQSAEMRGHAFLTSSAETEAAQESDRLRASYFTHYLISGLRGAADVNADGKITLNEAYQFAFQETLGRTVNSQGGAQHPSYDIQLSGMGDVTMTDVRQTTATLLLGSSLEGRIFVRNAREELVVELYKAQGRKVELGLEPGLYEVRVERPTEAWLAKAHIGNSQRLDMELDQFSPTKPEPTRRRGLGIPNYAVAGRNRLELQFGMWRAGSSSDSTPKVSVGTDSTDFLCGIRYTRFVREDFSITLGAEVLPKTTDLVTESEAFTGSMAVVAVPLGVRWNPMRGDLRSQAVKPYLTVGFGPVLGSSSGVSTNHSSVFVGNKNAATVAGFFGAGADVLTGRWLSLSVSAGYCRMADFSQPIGSRKNYSGLQVSVGIGWVFGKGYDRHP